MKMLNKNSSTIFVSKEIMIQKILSFKLFFLLIITISIISTAGCGNNKDNNRGQYEIWMQNTSFVPQTLNIPLGTTVTWTNQDSIAHTVTSADTSGSQILFDSGSIGMGDNFNYKFNKSGVYHYYCKIHSKKMNGVIIVQ